MESGLIIFYIIGGMKMEQYSRKKSLLADLSLLLVAIIWGSGFIVIKNALDFMDPIYMLVLRFTLSSILMAMVFFKRLKTINKEDLKAGTIIGIFLFIAFVTQTVGLQFTTVSKQAFITASNVVMVPFIIWYINKKRPDIFEIIAAILCFIGIGVLSLEGSLIIGLGDGLTLICAVFFACHIVSVGYYSKKHDPIVLTILQFAVAAILSFLTALVLKIEFAPITREIGLSILYMAVFSTILAFGIQNVAQKYTSSTHAAIILSTESVFGSLFSVWLLSEKFTIRLFIGCILIFIAVITAETKWSFLNKSQESPLG